MRKKKSLVIAAIFTPLWIFYFVKGGEYGGAVGYIGAIPGFFVGDSSYIRAAERSGWSLASDAYYQLEQRNRSGAEEWAFRDIHSDNDILWQYAAGYLASQGDQRSIPYLIKLMRHRNQTSSERRMKYLRELTGHDLGDSFSAWCDWYESESAGIKIDWTSDPDDRSKVIRQKDKANKAEMATPRKPSD